MLNDPVLDSLVFKVLSGLVMGAILGSFATMLSYRLPRGLSIVTPPSSCPKCKTRLGPRDLVPLFSWLFSKGRCRHCGAKISGRYPLIELATIAATLAAFIGFGFSWELLAALAVIVAAVTAGAMRIEKRYGRSKIK